MAYSRPHRPIMRTICQKISHCIKNHHEKVSVCCTLKKSCARIDCHHFKRLPTSFICWLENLPIEAGAYQNNCGWEKIWGTKSLPRHHLDEIAIFVPNNLSPTGSLGDKFYGEKYQWLPGVLEKFFIGTVFMQSSLSSMMMCTKGWQPFQLCHVIVYIKTGLCILTSCMVDYPHPSFNC